MIEDGDAEDLSISRARHIHPLRVLAPDLFVAQAFAIQDVSQARSFWLFQTHRLGEADAERSFFRVAEDNIFVASSQSDLEIEESLVFRSLINAQRLCAG